MDNNILKQFGDISVYKDYEFGTITEIKPNDIYIVETSKGLQLTIQDVDIEYIVGDSVLLSLYNGSTNNAFIIKKSSKAYPVAVNFIVDNNLN